MKEVVDNAIKAALKLVLNMDYEHLDLTEPLTNYCDTLKLGMINSIIETDLNLDHELLMRDPAFTSARTMGELSQVYLENYLGTAYDSI